ncbi:MAG: hypothetical protein PHF35_05185 [Candidatus Moranbacteria bacterium]|nr:hypothetical protein [Candidatus Moranbacteria bacterium]
MKKIPLVLYQIIYLSALGICALCLVAILVSIASWHMRYPTASSEILSALGYHELAKKLYFIYPGEIALALSLAFFFFVIACIISNRKL